MAILKRCIVINVRIVMTRCDEAMNHQIVTCLTGVDIEDYPIVWDK